MTDFGCYWLATIREGYQSPHPDGWTYVVYYDSKRYYYDAPLEAWLGFMHWVTEHFTTEGVQCPFRIVKNT